MALFLSFAGYAILVHLAGLGFMALLYKGAPRLGLLSYYACAGICGMGLVYLTGIIGYAFGLPVQISPFIVLTALLLGVTVFTGYRPFRTAEIKTVAVSKIIKNIRVTDYAVIVFVLFQLCYIIFVCFWRPVALTDDWTQWSGNAKYLFFHGIPDAVYFKENWHSDYPLFIMINEQVLCRIAGGWDDYLCKSFSAILFIDFLFLFSSIIKEQLGWSAGLFTAFLLVLIPFYLRIGFDGTGEVPLSVFLVLSALFLWRFSMSADKVDILLAGFFSAMAVISKVEGLYSVIVIMASYFLFLHKGSRYFKTSGFVVLPIAVFVLPWSYLKHAGFNSADRWRVFSLDWMKDLSSYTDILSTLGSLVIDRNLSLLGITFIVAFVWWFFKNRNDKTSLFLITALIGSVYIFAIGSYSTGWPDQFARLVTQDTGLILFFTMLQYGATIKGSAGQN